jgi:hypothetical protein
MLIRKEQIKSSLNLMKYRHQVWWNIIIKFDEISFVKIWWDTIIKLVKTSFIKFDEISSSDLMRCCLSNLTKYISSNLMKRRLSNLMICRSCLMSRFRQNLMNRSRQALIISKKLKSDNRNINDEMIKHDHENEFTEIFLQKRKFEIAFLDHISHFETKCKTRY